MDAPKLDKRSLDEVVAQTENAVDLMHAITSFKPNVAVIDIRMPPTHTDEGVRAARRIREASSEQGEYLLSDATAVGLQRSITESRRNGFSFSR